jgi:multisubunit Na+/H+ antiporter MnhB subunit
MKLIQVCSIILLLLSGAVIYLILPHPEIQAREVDTSWVRIAGQMGIQNMVTAVYLGPRVLDTFIEVMVVVLTVFGMKFLREHI